jgi:hypothetical protein
MGQDGEGKDFLSRLENDLKVCCLVVWPSR